jgi:hypothetical protein
LSASKLSRAGLAREAARPSEGMNGTDGIRMDSTAPISVTAPAEILGRRRINSTVHRACRDPSTSTTMRSNARGRPRTINTVQGA